VIGLCCDVTGRSFSVVMQIVLAYGAFLLLQLQPVIIRG